MRTSKREKAVRAERKTLEQKRSAESRARKEKRKVKGQAADIAMEIQRSPAGKKAAETLKAKRELLGQKEQANYQKTQARASTRMGGRRKQIQGEAHDELEA